tara:strand:- start:65 stop:595 length:531 start_codon:yes stop_codon:yes gene_type:complete
MFGKPNSFSNTKDGFAYWKTSGLFNEHLLRDEYIKHCVPRNHYDFFYSSVRFFVPKTKVFDILQISGSITYDGLKKYITARCGGIGANIATLYLCMKVANGDLSINQIKERDMYPRLIGGELMTYDEMKREMIRMKSKNSKEYKKELRSLFATYAFSKCYTKRRRSNKYQNKTRKL